VILCLIAIRWCVVVASATYGLFVAANIVYEPWAMYSAAALLGLGASILWSDSLPLESDLLSTLCLLLCSYFRTAQGVFVARAAEYHEISNGLFRRSLCALNRSNTRGEIRAR